MAWATEEERARWNANRRKKYAEDSEHRARSVARNRAWLRENRDENNRRLRERRKNDPEWRERKLVKLRGRDQRHQQLKTNYGITLEQYQAMKAAQNGCCAICGNEATETLCVDHCHSTGLVRGLLCRACNTGLGCYGDKPDLLKAAIAYLERHRGT